MSENLCGVRRLACALFTEARFGKTDAKQASLQKAAASCRTPKHFTAPRRGLTLIEVMLAIVILGVGSGVLMLATARCIAVVSKARHYSNAQRLIQQVLAEHPLSRNEEEFDIGLDSGDFDGGYTWEHEIIETEDEGREGLYTVRVRVGWSSRGKERYEEIVTWHYIKPEDLVK